MFQLCITCVHYISNMINANNSNTLQSAEADDTGFKFGTKEFWNISNWDIMMQWLVLIVLVLILILIIICVIFCVYCIRQRNNTSSKDNTIKPNANGLNESTTNNGSNISSQTKTRRTIANKNEYNAIPAEDDTDHDVIQSCQMDTNSVNACLIAAEMTTGNEAKQDVAVTIPMTNINEREESKISNDTITTTQSTQEVHENIDDEKDSEIQTNATSADLWGNCADRETNNATPGNQALFYNHNHPSVRIPISPTSNDQQEKPHIIDTPSLPRSEPRSEGPPLTQQTQPKITWDKHQIDAWVRSHGEELQKYGNKFLANGINGRGLCHYGDDQEKLKKVFGKVVSDEIHRDQLVVNWMALA